MGALVAGLQGCVPEPSEGVTLGGVDVRVVVADEPAEWSRGLQGYDELEPGEGMLFIFDESRERTFAMMSVAFPIDVVFISEDSIVTAIEPLEPGETRLVTSPGPAPYVLELPQGWAADEGIGVGSELEVPDTLDR